MPAWNEILNETQEAGSVHDIIRRRHLKRLSDYTNRNAIIYYSGWLQKPHLEREASIALGISDADKAGFMSVVHKLEDRSAGLDLILHTPGGDLAATESLVDYLRAMFPGDIRAVIPQLAMSGGTIMALASNRIVMGKQSSIGPVDPQFGAMAATGLLQEFERIRREVADNPSNALLWDPILRRIEPGFITECENVIKWSRYMAERFLRTGMFAQDADCEQKISNIISHLTDHEKTFTHGRHIGLSEAQSVFGDKVLPLEEDNQLQDLVLTLHHAAIITLQATPCYKMIENQMGRAFMQIAQVHLVPPSAG